MNFFKRAFFAIDRRGLLNFVPDKPYLQMYYRMKFGRKLNLKHPEEINEKLQWLKLYNRKPEFNTMVDKYEVKKYVADRIGQEYIIPTLGVWDTFDQIDFNKLPNQFVLKCTHDSGGLVICKDKSKLDRDAAREKISRSLKNNYYYSGREWPYKNVKPRIIAEKYMIDQKTSELRDYKFYCFDGKVKTLMINSNRQSDGPTTGDYYDRDFHHLDFQWGMARAKIPPERPCQMDKMIKLAEKLSDGLIHARIDLYLCNDQIYFGEITFFDGSGFDPVEPRQWALTLGSWVHLPLSNQK